MAANHLAPVVDRMPVHPKRSGGLFLDETRAPIRAPKADKIEPWSRHWSRRLWRGTGHPWAVTREDRCWAGGNPPAVAVTMQARVTTIMP